MKTLDEMLSLRLISREQHAEIGSWIAEARTPQAIMRMPAPLWRADLASLGLTERDFINDGLDAIADYATRSPDIYFQKYGEKPGASLLIWTWTLVMSGTASMGRR